MATDTHSTDLLPKLETAALVGIGGFAGSNLRYFVGTLVPGLAGTLLVNTLGSFVLGVVLYEALYAARLGERTRVVVGTGFLASFTTYSTFVVGTLSAPAWLAAANLLASYALGFAGVLVGRAVAGWIAEGEM